MQGDYQGHSAQEWLQDDSFLRWLRNDGSADFHFWENWIIEHPESAAIVEEARELFEQLCRQFPEVQGGIQEAGTGIPEQTEAWTLIEAVMQRKEIREPGLPPVRMLMTFLGNAIPPGRVFRIAASILLAAGAFSIWQWAFNRHPLIEVVASAGTLIDTLPDGSTVFLHQGSVLRYEQEINRSPIRNVWLQGEAFFDVSHEINKMGKRTPFIVHTDSSQVDVLGTRFNVQESREGCVVVLQNGSVALNNAHERLILRPGEMGIIRGVGIEKAHVNPALYNGWINGKIILDNTRLEEILQVLHYSLGYSIQSHLTPEKLNQSISGSIDLTNKAQLIRTLSLVFDISISDQKNYFTITNR